MSPVSKLHGCNRDRAILTMSTRIGSFVPVLKRVARLRAMHVGYRQIPSGPLDKTAQPWRKVTRFPALPPKSP